MKSEIELLKVSKTFKNQHKAVPVIKELTCKVEKGSIVSIIGPSGSGKSTILSLCNLLQTKDEGEILIDGKEIEKWDIGELRRYVGIAFQAAPMLQGSALENLILPARLKGKRLENPSKFMEYVGLSEELLTREVKGLSGGQRQRLSLARTLVNKPSILLLDEVTSALDSISAHEIEKLILRINVEQQTTILWVTHDLSQAERVGDQTWLIIDGSLVEAASTNQLFSNPQEARTREFLEKEREFV